MNKKCFKCEYKQRAKSCPKLHLYHSEKDVENLESWIIGLRKSLYAIKNMEIEPSTVCTPIAKVSGSMYDCEIPSTLLVPVIEATEKVVLQYIKNAKTFIRKQTKIYKEQCNGCEAKAEDVYNDIIEYAIHHNATYTEQHGRSSIFNNMGEFWKKYNTDKQCLSEIEKECKKLISIPKHLR